MKMIENMTEDEKIEFIAKLIPRKFGPEEARGFFAGANSMFTKTVEEKVLAREDAITRAYLEREAEPDGFQHSLGFRLLAAIATGGLLFLFVALPPEREER